MHVALCLSGQPRTWRVTHAGLLAFFAGHDVDVFLHTWREGDPAELAAVVEAYAPRAHVIEDRPLFAVEKRLLAARFPTRPPLTVFDMFHSVDASLRLASQDGSDYDLLVRARFDAQFDGVWSEDAPGVGELIIPANFPNPAGCNDQFAIGRPAEMAAYGALADWLPGALANLKGDWFRPEVVVRSYLEDVCGLRLNLLPISMRLRRDNQSTLPFAALIDDPLFHAEKHEAWEAFALAQFPDLAPSVDFYHASRTPLELDRALTAWLENHQPKEGYQLLKAPWPRRIKAVDEFITAQAGDLAQLDDATYQGVRSICAMLLQRMDRSEPMTLESFVVHVLSANIEDMRRAAEWGEEQPRRLDGLPKAVKGLGLLVSAINFTPPMEQTGSGGWRR